MSSVEASLTFDSEKGLGYYPVADAVYDEAYFQKYVAYGQTTFGIALNSLRAGLVSKYISREEALIDVGSCDGAFIRARRGNTYGFDINPTAQYALEQSGNWRDIQEGTLLNASFWDVLEHIEVPDEILRRVLRYCFVSIPIFKDDRHVLSSKHYRPTEHYWYFTKAGLIRYFWDLGFICVEINDMETSLGREDIGTFVFQRRIDSRSQL